MKPSDLLEAAHIGHEDVDDDHQVEGRTVESGETAGAAIGDRDPQTTLPQPGSNGQADMRLVVDNHDTAHNAPCRPRLESLARESTPILFRPQNVAGVYPAPCIGTLMQVHICKTAT